MNNSVSRAAILLILNIVSIHSIAQGFQIDGLITDQQSGNPIPFVTVYINGTTRGNITNQQGQFVLHDITLPCELILSHVSYQLKSIPLQDSTQLENVSYTLLKRVIQLKEVTVVRNLVKTDYMERFKNWFLGVNYRDERAEILNDSVLIFHVLENEQFTVEAMEPLKVLLPRAGYVLNVDLAHFRLLYKEELEGYHCSILGYYYFDSFEPRSRRHQRKMARARVRNFYNTGMHFCQSLYQNQLAENGYIFKINCPSEKENVDSADYRYDINYKYITDDYGNRQMMLINSSCNDFLITYHENFRKRPVDLTYLETARTTRKFSGLSFLSYTIHILPSGRIPGNTVLFSGAIGKKGIAYLLPVDYIPSMQ